MRSEDDDPFQGGGPLSNFAEAQFSGITVKDYADIAMAFMLGLPSQGSAGFSMLQPSELRRERITVVKYWLKRMETMRSDILRSLTKR